MVKVTLVKFVSNIAYWLGGGKRENFKKWDQVIVGKDDVLPLRRLGCEILDEVEVNFKDHKDLFKKSKKEKVETEKVEAPAETEVKNEVEQTA